MKLENVPSFGKYKARTVMAYVAKQIDGKQDGLIQPVEGFDGEIVRVCIVRQAFHKVSVKNGLEAVTRNTKDGLRFWIYGE